MRTSNMRAALFAGERLFTYNEIESLIYLREGVPNHPLVLFLPGGAHLGRIAYGDPASRRSDFLDHWLEKVGMGMLAISYPSDHPAICSKIFDLNLTTWADWIASVTNMVLGNIKSRPVIVAMWSMAGRSVAAVNDAFLRQGINNASFISLAATPPLPGLMPLRPGGEILTKTGLWARTIDVAPDGIHDRFTQGFLAELSYQAATNGGEIIADDVYVQQYLCNTPIMLRGTAQRYGESGTRWDAHEAQNDMKASSFDRFPITSMIIPTERSDEGHVLGDRTAWHFLNVQRIRADATVREIDDLSWSRLRDLIAALPTRLSREVQGGHFFFVGAKSAETTVLKIQELIGEERDLRGELKSIFGSGFLGASVSSGEHL